MVGRPKGIVRGRPMTPVEEAAYVRQVASQKTAALRTSLDAVERQRMPFRGESGGVGAGQGMGAVPERQADEAPPRHPQLDGTSHRAIPMDPELAKRLEEARRDAARHDDHERRARPSGTAPAMTGTRERTIAVGGQRDVPSAVARDYLLLALRLDQHLPGLVDAYFGPADLKALTELEPERSRPPPSPTRRQRSATGSPPRSGTTRAATGWTSSCDALERRPRVLAGPRRLPYVEQVTPVFAWTPQRAWQDDATFDSGRGGAREGCCRAMGSLEERLRAMDEAMDSSPSDAGRGIVVKPLVTRSGHESRAPVRRAGKDEDLRGLRS